MTDEHAHIARAAAALDGPKMCRDIEDMTDVQDETPARIRVAQDADGFWTCREAVSGSPEYVRSDIARQQAEEIKRLRGALERIDQLARLVAHDLQGRVEGGKVAAVLQCADIALAAMDTPKGGEDA